MTQLNVFKMDKQTLAARKHFVDINDGNKMHQLLTASIDSNRKQSNLLYRLTFSGESVFLYVTADIPVNIEFLEGFGFKFLYNIDLNNILETKESGSTVLFNIRLLPYIRKGDTYSYIGDINSRIQWASNKLSQCGLSVCAVKETAVESLVFKRGTKYTSISSSVFCGIAKIADKNALTNTVHCGIGREKCFGAGMLMIQ